MGGFPEYVLIPNAELNKQVYLVPEEISSKAASLIVPFTVGCRAARHSFPRKEGICHGHALNVVIRY